MATIRLATVADAKAIADIYRPVVEHTAISFELVPPTESEMTARLAAGMAYAPWLVAVESGLAVAFAYGSKHRERLAYQWSVDVSVYVDARRRRAGLGRALYASLLDILQLQGFCAAHAGITMDNASSIAMHEAVGFRRVGVFPSVGFKLGAWHDVGWWQRALGARPAAPSPPRPFAEVRDRPEVAAALSSRA